MEAPEDFEESERWLAIDWSTAMAIAAQLEELAKVRLDLSRNKELNVLLLDELVKSHFEARKANAALAKVQLSNDQDPC